MIRDVLRSWMGSRLSMKTKNRKRILTNFEFFLTCSPGLYAREGSLTGTTLPSSRWNPHRTQSPRATPEVSAASYACFLATRALAFTFFGIFGTSSKFHEMRMERATLSQRHLAVSPTTPNANVVLPCPSRSFPIRSLATEAPPWLR